VPVKGETKLVLSSMFYMLVIQNNQIMPDCFRLGKFTINDGALSLWRINSEGKVMELLEGSVFNGKFLED
jgi:hypothetical protein